MSTAHTHQSAAKMKSRSNSLYQIDCSIGSSGKKIAVTKRRIRWRFGFVNETAVESGESGVECRGHEHEVTLTWSITSGKRLVLQDGEELHFSVGRRSEGKFQFTWNGPGQHVFKIIAYAAPPLKPTPGFKQFDLLVDGKSFGKFPLIYELGTSTKNSPNSRRTASSQKSIKDREMRWAQSVIQMEQKREMNQPFPQHSPSTITTASSANTDFFSDPIHVETSQDLLSSPVAGSVESPYSQQEHQAPSQNFIPQNSHDQFNPNQPPSYDAIWSSIMDAYDMNSNAPSEVVSSPCTNEAQPSTPVVEAYVPHNNEAPSFAPAQNSVFKPVNDSNERSSSPHGVDSVGSAVDNLVNLDDILSPAMSTKLTMNHPENDKENRGRSANSSKSQGIPPKGSTLQLGRQLSLRELKNIQPNGNANISQPNRTEVMKVHEQQYAAPVQGQGALVVYGQPQQQYGNYMTEPPPLPKVNGFGLGATVTYQSYR